MLPWFPQVELSRNHLKQKASFMNHERPHVTVTNNLLRCALYEKIHVLMRQKCLLKRSLDPQISIIKYCLSSKLYFIDQILYSFKNVPLGSGFVFVCLLLSVRSRIIRSYGDITAGERLQNLGLSSAVLCPFCNEGSLSCHTCCDRGPWFLRYIPPHLVALYGQVTA